MLLLCYECTSACVFFLSCPCRCVATCLEISSGDYGSRLCNCRGKQTHCPCSPRPLRTAVKSIKAASDRRPQQGRPRELPVLQYPRVPCSCSWPRTEANKACASLKMRSLCSMCVWSGQRRNCHGWPSSSPPVWRKLNTEFRCTNTYRHNAMVTHTHTHRHTYNNTHTTSTHAHTQRERERERNRKASYHCVFICNLEQIFLCNSYVLILYPY